jgi:hypothetical protein
MGEHMRYLEQLERKITNGDVVLDAETEWDQFVRGVDNVTSKLSEMSSLDTDVTD